jgi:aspartyl-tRNA(Asn)/glutamyl-tRNA(Gln) amidotransferase subunit B
LLNEEKVSLQDMRPAPVRLTEMISLIDAGKISFSTASSRLLPKILEDENASVLEMATSLHLLQSGDETELQHWVKTVLNRMPDKVSEYRKGKKGLIGLFIAEVKKLSKGKADLKAVSALLEKELSEQESIRS